MTQRLSLSDIEALAQDSLTRAGVPRPAAGAAAAEIMASEAAGERAHGLEALLRDLRLIRYGRVDPVAEMRLDRTHPARFRLCAGHGLAAAALASAVHPMAERARNQGVSLLRLEDASYPGLMIRMVTALSDLGLTALAYGTHGPGRQAHPKRTGSTPLPDPPRAFLSLTSPEANGQPYDSPFGGPVRHGAWVLAADPHLDQGKTITLFDHAPPPGAKPSAQDIALTSELLKQIVTA